MKPSKLHDENLHKTFREYGKNAKEWLRKCALLLPEIEKRQIWRKKGFSSIHEYAGKLAGMSHSAVSDALWVLRKIENKAELMKVVEEKGIYRVKPIANLTTSKNELFWAEKARNMSQQTLKAYAFEYRKQHGLPDRLNVWVNPKTQPENQSRVTLKISLPLKLGKRLDRIQKREDFEQLLEKFLDSVEQQEQSQKPIPVETQSRHIPATIRNHVLSRTGNKCAFPGCARPYEILHHTQRFASERVHDPDRLQPLCKAHERMAHHGLIEEEEKSPVHWKLRLEPDRNDYKFHIDQQVAVFRGT